MAEDATVGIGSSLLGRAAMLRRRLIVAIVAAIPVVLLSMLPALQFYGWQWVVALCSLPVLTWCAWPLYTAAFNAARHGGTTMDTLVTLGVIAATVWSVISLLWGSAGELGATMQMSLTPRTITPGAHLYFEGAVMVTTFVLAGRYMEARSRYRAGDAVRALLQLQSRTAMVVQADRSCEKTEIEDIARGALVRVSVGERFPVDGVIERGRTSVDTAAITGESMPRDVGEQDQVFAGYVNMSGVVDVRVQGEAADTRLARIAQLVAQVQSTKPPIQRLVDRISGVFVPVVMGIALLAFAGWLIWDGSFARAVTAATAVLVVACPCALGLATPTALLVGTGRAAQLGIVIARSEVLEKSLKVDTVVFDKTGTLTTGEPILVGSAWSEVAAQELLGTNFTNPTGNEATAGSTEDVNVRPLIRVVAKLEQASHHPFANALLDTDSAKLENSANFTDPTDPSASVAQAGSVEADVNAISAATDFAAIVESPGKGLVGRRANGALADVVIGSRRWLQELGVSADDFEQLMQRLDNPAATVSFIATGRFGATTSAAQEKTTAVTDITTESGDDATAVDDENVEVTLDVLGMTCASCVRRVEKKLNRVEGASATVNLATETAVVSAPQQLDPEQLVEVVRNAGYEAKVRGVAASSHSTDTVATVTEIDTDQVSDLKLIGVVAVADQARESAKQALAELRELNVEPMMLTGDHPGAANAIATEIGMPTTHVHAQVGPEQKQEFIKQLQEEPQKHTVAVIGDGINDAAALAQAGTRGIGIAMGQGTDVAIQAADMVISSQDPAAVAAALRISRRTMKTIRTNLAWAFAYNIIAIPLAAAGLVSPMIAAATMAASSVIVVGNSLRLRRVS